MTTAHRLKIPAVFQLPEPPKTPDEKMTASKHLSITGRAHSLLQHLGNWETTVVGSDLYILPVLPSELANMTGSVYPDLVVAFDADPELYYARNGYVISEQGKPPDFVLEVASSSTGRRDTVEKPVIYARLGILEYWRFDETGQYHRTRLAGDRLVNGVYAPIEIEELPGGVLQGYSPTLNLYLRWQDGQLHFHDPDTGERIASFESERARAEQAESRAEQAENRVEQAENRVERAESHAENEREARIRAESRAQRAEAQVEELRAELQRRRDG